jgi:hypothetical protein
MPVTSRRRAREMSLPPLAFVGGMTVAVVVAATLMVLGSRGPDRPGPAVAGAAPPAVRSSAEARHVEPADPRRQARALAAVARRAPAAQEKSEAAIAQVLACDDLTAAKRGLRAAVEGRSALLTRLAKLDVSALPGGAAAVGDLREAQETLLRADRAYLQWALAAAWSCDYDSKPGVDLSYSRAVEATQEAAVAERRFAHRWTVIARYQ